jgi:serine/threonine protein kinase
MSDEADELFVQAREILDAQEREAFLEQACPNNPELLGQIRGLLDDEARAESYFASHDPQGKPETIRLDFDSQQSGVPSEQEGQWIGRYRLLQHIGEGGFGMVWMAEQTEPVIRKVALKIIKQGMDTREVIARFEAERQALAMMDHPNIAKILDAGATDTGRPFFVMELVKGMPVTEFCNQRQLDMPQRLQLFAEICSAVHHAHQKGIIHRDIKPSNVLVTLHGDRPVPMVIDFGIAKATQARLTAKTLFTRFDQFIGTPAYMSPEQAALSGLDIDIRSDIYSLGMLLYELLTGKPPFDARSLYDAGFDEMRRIIVEEEPPRPSVKLSSTVGEEADLLANSHQAGPGRLSQFVRGDLDWIVMKAISKDREQRYQSANDLVADIGHFLADEPVTATPPSTSYRLSKAWRRNKTVFTAAAGVFVSLALGTVVSTWQAVRAVQAERSVSGLLDESKARQLELSRTVALLTESTEELSSHMRRFLIGRWEMHMRFDEESLRKNVKGADLPFFNSLYKGLAGDMSSRLEFHEDGTSTGETVVPPIFQAMTPLMDKKRITDGRWDLTKQQGKRTTVKISSHGLAGIKHSDEFTITIVDSGNLLMENPEWSETPVKPIITFKRLP